MAIPVPRADTPEEVHAVIEDAFNRGDLDAFVAVHEADATVAVPPDGGVAHGLDAIRAATAPIFALRPQVTIRVHRKLQSGDLAVTRAYWELVGTASDRSLLHLSGHGTIVSRRRVDGTWGIVIDDPLSGIHEETGAIATGLTE